MQLNPTLPITRTMYLVLINKYTKIICNLCPNNNSNCKYSDKEDTCSTMVSEINKTLVFHTGVFEYATTYATIELALQRNQETKFNEQFIGKTVNDVIKHYGQERLLSEKYAYALYLHGLLNPEDIIAEVNWT